MVKPPRNPGGTRIFEIDDGVLVPIKVVFVEQSASAVQQTRKHEVDIVANAFSIEARKQCRRGSAVKALIVIENSNSQIGSYSCLSRLRHPQIEQEGKLIGMPCKSGSVKRSLCHQTQRGEQSSSPLEPLDLRSACLHGARLLFRHVANRRQLEHLPLIGLEDENQPDHKSPQSDQRPEQERKPAEKRNVDDYVQYDP